MKSKIIKITLLSLLFGYAISSNAQTLNISLPYISFLENSTHNIDATGENIFLIISVPDYVSVNPTLYRNNINDYLIQQGLDSIISVNRLLSLHPDFYENGTPPIESSIRIIIKENFGVPRTIILTGVTGDTVTINQSFAAIPEPSLDIDGNWILTRIFTDTTSYNEDVTFLNGLGYPELIIQVQGSPNRKNIVTPVVYDNMMREDAKSYLPYVSNSTTPTKEISLPLIKQHAYYTNNYGYDEANYAFVEKRYEASALNRVEKEYYPGKDFRSSFGNLKLGRDGKYKGFEYHTNSEEEVFILNVHRNTAELTVSGYYEPGTLYKNKIKDEDDRVTITFVDKSGNIVLQRAENETENNDTYYAYDDCGQKCWVISPEGSDLLVIGNTYQPTDVTLAKKYCYIYTYDGIGRQITKQIPDKSIEYMVYDRGNRIVMSQDGRQRVNNRWIIYQYDNFNRISNQYIITDNRTQSILQNLFDNSNNNDNTSNSIYNSSTKQLLTKTQYDDYTNINSVFEFAPVPEIAENTYDARTKGLKTYEKIAVLTAATSTINQYTERTYYYDNLNRVIQTVEKNYLGGISRTSFKYDFSGNVLSLHESNAVNATAIPDIKLTTFTYDHRGRLLTDRTVINTSDTTKTDYKYNGLGQLTAQVYNDTITETTKYNIQGWITEKQAYLGDMEEIIFDTQLKYYNPSSTDVTPSYTGNITEWYCSDATNYTFSYDKLNRIATKEISNLGGWTSITGLIGGLVKGSQYSERGFTYDKNGNMLTLKRYDEMSTLMDDLLYSYNGNQLTELSGTTSANYTYDINGNMIHDGRKNINIEYNLLNLPYQIHQNITLKATYTYLADGTKAGVTDDNDKGFVYLGSMVYNKNGNDIELESTNFGGGRINATNNNYEVNYFITDHLGSTRVVVNQDGTVLGRNNYYPFGKLLEGTNTQAPTTRYTFSGKEIQTTGGVNYLDFGARMYDDFLGRWFNIDPLAEKMPWQSSYIYCSNNPINRIDPDGRADYWAISEKGIQYLGSDGVDDDAFRIAQMSKKETNYMEKSIKNIRKDKASDSDRDAVYGENTSFVNLEIQSQTDQDEAINHLKSRHAETGREHGSMMTITFDEGKAKLSFGPIISGNSQNIGFGYTGNYENFKDGNGNTVIGTVHTHSHNNGLSGQGADYTPKSDMALVANSNIIWYTVGPTKTHVGYKDQYRSINHYNVPSGTNLLRDALRRIQR